MITRIRTLTTMRTCLLPLAIAVTLQLAAPATADDAAFADLARQAQELLRSGRGEDALAAAGRAIAAVPEDDPRGYRLRGDLHAALAEHGRAVADYSAAIERDARASDLYDRRGSEQFKLGRVAESIDDFDRAIALRPELERGHWKRGISYYYAGQYDAGRRQFEGYQTVDDNDVENAVWRYLCMARGVGVERARADLLSIKRDRRVPMMEVYRLFAGQLAPGDVLAAAEAGEPTDRERNERLFYAHLYVGLWYEAAGEAARAAEHLAAAEKHRIGHYMWDVARVHAARLRAGGAAK